MLEMFVASNVCWDFIGVDVSRIAFELAYFNVAQIGRIPRAN